MLEDCFLAHKFIVWNLGVVDLARLSESWRIFCGLEMVSGPLLNSKRHSNEPKNRAAIFV